MDAILNQMGLNSTFFIQLGIIAFVFIFLSQVYFRPFMKLFQLRHKRLVEDRESAENLVKQAEAKLEEYKNRLNEERANARREIEGLIETAKREEAKILESARAEAKKITQEAVESAQKQKESISKQLESEVETLARTISETLLVRHEK